MKVIEIGTVSKKIKCPTCNSKLEYDPSDIIRELENTNLDIYSEEDNKQAIICPICHTTIKLKGAEKFLANFFSSF